MHGHYLFYFHNRSAHSNAYFYGFWTSKCIVLFDTLLEDGILPKKEEDKSGESKEDTEPKESEEVVSEETESKQDKKKAKGCNTNEILAVLAHELGHWKLSHNLKNIVIAEVISCQIILCQHSTMVTAHLKV